MQRDCMTDMLIVCEECRDPSCRALLHAEMSRSIVLTDMGESLLIDAVLRHRMQLPSDLPRQPL